MILHSAVRTRLLALGWTLLLCACGGGGGSGNDSSSPAPASSQLQTLSISGYPHAVDVYRTAGATRALVLLHGGGGNKSAIAYQLGLNSSTETTTASTINWTWLEANKLMVVVPQGQHLASEPNATTWNNYAMTSGQDDKAFLQALVARVRADYGVSSVALAGHSMGGAMTNRIWCESPGSFDAYVSLAGPASAHFLNAATPCAPGSAAKPYMGIIGDADDVMQTAGRWEAATWTVNPVWVQASVNAWVNDQVIAELAQQQQRTSQLCGATLAANDYSSTSQVDTWSSCSGRLQLLRVHGADHGVASLDAGMGASSTMDVMNTLMAFIAR
jgi:polyhydroxybutyrate depolymerase